MNFKIGDYVEPKDDILISDDIIYEDLFGFIEDINEDLVTIRSIGRNKENIIKKEYIEKANIPDIFKKNARIRK